MEENSLAFQSAMFYCNSYLLEKECIAHFFLALCLLPILKLAPGSSIAKTISIFYKIPEILTFVASSYTGIDYIQGILDLQL